MIEENANKCVDLDTCVEWLMELIKNREDLLESLKNKSESDFLLDSHHGIGTGIRNCLGLWFDGKSVPYFNSLGIYHADDMSSMILITLHRKYHGVDVDLKSQVDEYIKYWEEVDPKVNTGERSNN